MFRGKVLCFSDGPLPLILSLGTTEKTHLHLLCTFLSGIYVSVVKNPMGLLQDENSQLLQLFLIGEMF